MFNKLTGTITIIMLIVMALTVFQPLLLMICTVIFSLWLFILLTIWAIKRK